MPPTARDRFWARAHAWAARRTPEQAREFLRALAILAPTLPTREVEAFIATGDVEAVIGRALADGVLDAAFARYRARAELTARGAMAYFGEQIPGLPAAQIQGVFNVLSPKVIEAVTRLDDRMMQTVKADVRETVRQVIRKGLEDGAGPRTTARALRETLGLAPNQLAAVENYSKSLREGKAGKALGYELRDRRYDGPTMRGTLSAEQIEKATAAYRRRMIAFNAETNARTATLDSMKEGQRLAWEEAAAKGYIDRGLLMKQWKGVMDDRERPEHVEMEGETVPIDTPYSNGEMVPGESTYNCRCLSIIFADVARAA